MEPNYILQDLEAVENKTSHNKMLVVISIAILLLILLLVLMYLNGKYIHTYSDQSLENTYQDISNPI